jgi:hydrogenase-1 operon protein HyaE
MTIELATTSTAGRPPAVHPLVQRLMQETGAPALEAAALDTWLAEPGHALLVFTEDPAQYGETLDLAVIVPELHAACERRFRVGVLLPVAARAAAPRYGFRRWPAVVLLKDGQYVGAIDGLRDWQDYLDELSRLLAAAPSRPPSIGIKVAADGGDARPCH